MIRPSRDQIVWSKCLTQTLLRCAVPHHFVINNACRKGFTSVSGYNRHKRKIHSAPKHLIRPQRNPYIPEIHLNLSGNEDGLQDIFEELDAEAPVEGAYYLKHPVLDGKS